MACLYGKHWIDMWADIPMEAVKAEWVDGLREFSLADIGKAITYCQTTEKYKFPPTLPEFRDLCKAMRQTPVVAKIARKYTPEELEQNREKLRKAFSVVKKPEGDNGSFKTMGEALGDVA